MNFGIKCHYDPETAIFYKHYSGNILLKDILDSWNEILKNNLVPKDTRRFIIDYTKANIIAPPEASRSIAAFYSTHPETFTGARIALIMQTPDLVVFPILVNEEQSIAQFSPFYTTKAAVRWLTE